MSSNYFSSIATKNELNISFSHKRFSAFLKNRSNISIFISPTDKIKIENIISTLDSNKSVVSNSIPTKVLKILKNDISDQLSEIFNISFSSGAFLSILKTVKVSPVHKKDSKLHLVNYCPISLLSNIERFSEKLMYNRIYKFLSYNNLIYSLQLVLEKNIQEFMLSLALLNVLGKT